MGKKQPGFQNWAEKSSCNWHNLGCLLAFIRSAVLKYIPAEHAQNVAFPTTTSLCKKISTLRPLVVRLIIQ